MDSKSGTAIQSSFLKQNPKKKRNCCYCAGVSRIDGAYMQGIADGAK